MLPGPLKQKRPPGKTPFRRYDATTGLFTGVGAMAEVTMHLTPYQFGANSPVMYNDPTGLLLSSGIENAYSDYTLFGNVGYGMRRYEEKMDEEFGGLTQGGLLIRNLQQGKIVLSDLLGTGGGGGKNDPKTKEKTDSTDKDENPDSEKKYYPPPKEGLEGFPEAGKGAYSNKSKRWRWKLPGGKILEWDKQHGEVEMYDKQGNHLGSYNPKNGNKLKDAVPGRTTPKAVGTIIKIKIAVKTFIDILKTMRPVEPGTIQLPDVRVPAPNCGCN